MSSSGIEKNRHTDKPAEQTGDFLSDRYTASDDHVAVPTVKHPQQPDPLLALLRPPQVNGELGRLAGFAVIEILGRGGMGAVFAAEDVTMHRRVALKVMRPELTARPEACERFLREAQTAGGVEHDHIIPVHQVGEDNGVLFIVMPLLKGEPLDVRLIREGRLPLTAVLKLGRETAEGLAAAHAVGLVHRDVKPGNLWLEGKSETAGEVGFRRVKILDFGLARAVQDDQHLTAAGGMLGTPAYMAPEQAQGEAVDHRADLFSLGAVLYRCCAGEAPFAGTTTMAVLSALANKTPTPLRKKNPNVPPALANLIMRLLAKAPNDRPQTASEVADALRRIEQEHTDATGAVVTAPAPRRRRVSTLTILLGLAAVLAMAAAIVLKVRTPDGKETSVTAPAGSDVNIDAKGNVTVALPVLPSAVAFFSPLDYQVFQRKTRLEGAVTVRGRVETAFDHLEYRLTGKPLEGAATAQWQALPSATGAKTFDASLPAPAGGWYMLEVHALKDGKEVGRAVVDHIGVGEVFVGAGQSNSTSCGQERIQPVTGLVSTFSGTNWRLADDPQPGAHDDALPGCTGGSFWPAFGDAMVEKYQVPIGVAVTGHSGTSVNQWQPGGEQFSWTVGRMNELGREGFRAVLWHQGESDAAMSLAEYVRKMTALIEQSRKSAGWDVPWFVAQASYHNPNDTKTAATRKAQQELWKSGAALEGPDTDTLIGDNRDNNGKGIHFSPKGLRAHGRLWADKVSAWLDKQWAK